MEIFCCFPFFLFIDKKNSIFLSLIYQFQQYPTIAQHDIDTGGIGAVDKLFVSCLSSSCIICSISDK